LRISVLKSSSWLASQTELREGKVLFLIEYDRKRGSIVLFRTFEDDNRELAQDARLDLELRLNEARIEHEVVLLEAPSEEAIRRTHRRYFETLEELLESPPSAKAVRERPTHRDSAD
jgi:hypothetical protein